MMSTSSAANFRKIDEARGEFNDNNILRQDETMGNDGETRYENNDDEEE